MMLLQWNQRGSRAQGNVNAALVRRSARRGTSRLPCLVAAVSGGCRARWLPGPHNHVVFATLLGALPQPTPDADGVSEDPVVAAIRAQEAAGLEPVTDGRLRDPGFDRLAGLLLRPDGVNDGVATVLEAWRIVAGATERATKQALPGPYSLGFRAGGSGARAESPDARCRRGARRDRGGPRGSGLPARRDRGVGGAPDSATDGRAGPASPTAHRRLPDGGPASRDSSLPVDRRSDPFRRPRSTRSSRRPMRASPSTSSPARTTGTSSVARRGSEVSSRASSRPARSTRRKEVMLWAAHYAASSGGRGRERVGLGSAGSWANLTWEAARRKLDRLGDAARLARCRRARSSFAMLDPRAVSTRRAAVGHSPRQPGSAVTA